MMATTITGLDMELKMKISGIKFLEIKTGSQTLKRVW